MGVEILDNGTRVLTAPGAMFGTDALLLGRFAQPRRDERALDLCSGCGIVSLVWHDAGHRGPCTALEIDPAAREVRRDGIPVELTYKEFELLMYLMRHKSIAVSRDKLMEMVWGYEFAGETRTVDMHIKTLRQKLESAGCTDLIKTVRGIGYKI